MSDVEKDISLKNVLRQEWMRKELICRLPPLSLHATQGAHAIEDGLKTSIQKKHQFDVVTFWATIEHLPDPLSALIKIRELLTPGGALFFDTGIGSDWLDNLLPGVVQWYDPPQHLFVFSPEGVRVILRKADFEVKSIDLNFESSNLRKVLKSIRGLFFGTVVRSATCLARVRQSPTLFTRYALGNLMLIEARKGVAPDEFENK